MLTQIPCHLIGGPLGAGKTSLLRALLAEKPAHERWAFLINEFGAIGLDAALLEQDDENLQIAEVAGGCLCCVNGAPFQVGLSRLLRKAQPQRLFIETSGLGHPLAIAEQLQRAPWHEVLQLQPLLMVLDAPALACGQSLSAEQQSAAEQAGLLILNKSAELTSTQREELLQNLPQRPVSWCEQGKLPFSALPTREFAKPLAGSLPPTNPTTLPHLWLDPSQPVCEIREHDGSWVIGWRWHPSQHFDLEKLRAWLSALPWQRAKLIVQQASGACSINAVAGQGLDWQISAWRKDSRIELIFTQAQNPDTLQEQLCHCLLRN